MFLFIPPLPIEADICVISGIFDTKLKKEERGSITQCHQILHRELVILPKLWLWGS